MLDHPRSAVAGLSLFLKLGIDPIYSFGDIAIFIICRFGWKLPIQAHYWGSFGDIFSLKIWQPILLSPKRSSLRGNTSFEP